MNSQDNNPYLFNTFKLNAADDACHLQSARLAVGNGIYSEEIEYGYPNITRIFKMVDNSCYDHTGSQQMV